jgi:hypothetical protein
MMKKVTQAIRTRRYRTGAAAVVIATTASVGFSTLTADAATASYPANQFGYVYSCTTFRDGLVATSDGGYIWDFVGSGGAGTEDQNGIVYSYTTERSAEVDTDDGGLTWIYNPYISPPTCSY